MSSAIAVRHEPERRRFLADVAGGEAFLLYNTPRDGVVTLVHTEVPEAAQGAGVAAALARAALTWARESRLLVRPLCPYVAAYIRRHPVHADLVAPSP